MSVSQSEADVIFNRANVALARSQRLVASWLPPKTAEELANAKSEEELQREEDEIFTPVPEKYVFIKALPFIATFVLFYSFFLFLIPGSGTTDRLFFFLLIIRLGLGAPLPQDANDGSWNRTELSSNDKLRRQLLGRNYQKATLKSSNQSIKRLEPGKAAPTAASISNKPEVASDEEEEEGRSTLLGKKKRKITATQDETSAISETVSGGEPTSSRTGTGSKGKKKAGSFLDEILAERSKKKKKK